MEARTGNLTRTYMLLFNRLSCDSIYILLHNIVTFQTVSRPAPGPLRGARLDAMRICQRQNLSSTLGKIPKALVGAGVRKVCRTMALLLSLSQSMYPGAASITSIS